MTYRQRVAHYRKQLYDALDGMTDTQLMFYIGRMDESTRSTVMQIPMVRRKLGIEGKRAQLKKAGFSWAS